MSSSVINFGKDFNQSCPFDDYGAEEIVLNFKHAAEQAEESGFEIIEINGGDQELLDQCFNTKYNHRKDAYGGSLKKPTQKGLTCLPLQIYLKNRHAKIEIGIARGKKLYDKREVLKKREQEKKIQQKNY